MDQSTQALAYYSSNGRFDSHHTAEALRALLDANITQEDKFTQEAFEVLRSADNYDGRISFLYIAPLAFLVAFIFLGVYINDKRKGGYQAERLDRSGSKGNH